MPEMIETNLNFDMTSAGAIVAPGGVVYFRQGGAASTLGWQEAGPIDDEFTPLKISQERLQYEKNGNKNWLSKITGRDVGLSINFLTAGCLKQILMVLGYDPSIIDTTDPTKRVALLDALPTSPYFEVKIVIPRVDGKDLTIQFARAQFFSDSVELALSKSEPAKLAAEIVGIIDEAATNGFEFLKIEEEV